jgi:hypothetical protein
VESYISHIFPLEKVSQTISDMTARKYAFTKILLQVEK